MTAIRNAAHPSSEGRQHENYVAGNLLARHDEYFETKIADTRALVEIAHGLRYQVYCLERKFENPAEHADCLETDAFDAHAIHGLLLHRPTKQAIGTVRMIMPQSGVKDSLPIMHLLKDDGIELASRAVLERTVEISRFAISKEYRRRKTDQNEEGMSESQLRRETMREGNLACLSLIQFLLSQSTKHGVLYWAAVMEPKLLRMLATMGIHFTSIGSLVMHHGLRQPSFCHLPTMLEQVRREHPEYWDVLTNGGRFDWPSRESHSGPRDLTHMAIAAE